MDDQIIRAAQKFSQISAHLSQAPSTKEVVTLLDCTDEDDVIQFLDDRVEQEKEVAEYIRAVFIGIIFIFIDACSNKIYLLYRFAHG